MRFERVLLATDFSDAAKVAASQAISWCHPAATFEAVHVVGQEALPPGAATSTAVAASLSRLRSDRVDAAQREMNRFVEKLPLGTVAHRIRTGSLVEEIHAEARSFQADLVVVGACRHPPVDHYFLGSKARALLWANSAQTSVFVGRDLRYRPPGGLRIAIGTDFDPVSRAAADRTRELLDRPGATIQIVHSLDTGTWLGETAPPVPQQDGPVWRELRSVAAAQLTAENRRAFGGKAREQLLVGEAATALVQFAKEQRLDLLVVGTAGARREGPVILGSVAADVAEKAPCSVLVVRP